MTPRRHRGPATRPIHGLTRSVARTRQPGFSTATFRRKLRPPTGARLARRPPVEQQERTRDGNRRHRDVGGRTVHARCAPASEAMQAVLQACGFVSAAEARHGTVAMELHRAGA